MLTVLYCQYIETLGLKKQIKCQSILHQIVTRVILSHNVENNLQKSLN